MIFCSGKLLAEAGAPSPSATPPKTIRPIKGKPSRCMILSRKAANLSCDFLRHKSRNEGPTNRIVGALQRRCALMEGLICFFIVVPRDFREFPETIRCVSGCAHIVPARFYQETRGLRQEF